MTSDSYTVLTSAEFGEFKDRMVAFEADGDQYPALVGMIISNFAHIERELPTIISRMTGMKQDDAVIVCAQFRAFSARLGILSSLLTLREASSHDRVVYSHCKGLMKEASELRNRYAHAKYAKGEEMMMLPYPNDLLGPEKWIPIPLEVIKADKERVSVILWELFAILHQKKLPKGLYGLLLENDR